MLCTTFVVNKLMY